MNGRHAGRVAIVTGAGSGIGRAIAVRLAAEGAAVVVNDIDGDRATETLRFFDADDGRHRIHPADVADPSAVAAMVQATAGAYGRLDTLVCNAAVNRTPGDGRDAKEARVLRRAADLRAGREPTDHPDQVVDMTDDGWRRMLAVNLDGTFFCCREALKVMSAANRGAIVCISSIAAQSGTGPVHYTAAKAGVIGLVRSLALEVAGRNIRVNAVCPGSVDTPMMRSVPAEALAAAEARIPLGRFGAPDDIAAAVSYLVSDEAAYVTGAVLPVNGGLFIG
jgi:3-oxoacyl-[acyl-carrier protein] reductase